MNELMKDKRVDCKLSRAGTPTALPYSNPQCPAQCLSESVSKVKPPLPLQTNHLTTKGSSSAVTLRASSLIYKHHVAPGSEHKHTAQLLLLMIMRMW